MDNILLSTGLAFIITFFAIPVIIKVTKEKKLFDEPDERKVHKGVIPTLGGLGIFAGFIIAILMGVPAGFPLLQYFTAACIVIFFLGIKDDILIISASKKFLGQLIAAGILIKFGGVQITNMQGLFGIYELPNVANMVLSAFTIIVITNSFNLIDGVDGLAGTLGLVTSLIFGIYFFHISQMAYAVMAFSLAGSLLSFLIFNFSPAKIFMGDTGSLLVGLINSILVIKFINISSLSTTSFSIEAAPAIGFAVLLIPLFDTLRVFALRIIDRRSPFSPDRNHIHHFLLELGFSPKQITLLCTAVNLFYVGLAYSLRSLGTTSVFGILLLTALSLTGLVYYFRQKKGTVIEKELTNTLISSRKFYTLASDTVEAE